MTDMLDEELDRAIRVVLDDIRAAAPRTIPTLAGHRSAPRARWLRPVAALTSVALMAVGVTSLGLIMLPPRRIGYGLAFLVCAALIAFPSLGRADVKPHVLFTDGAVLQRGIPVPVWGTADDGEKVPQDARPRVGESPLAMYWRTMSAGFAPATRIAPMLRMSGCTTSPCLKSSA